MFYGPRLLIKPRQFGKTWECISRSAETGNVIVTKDVATARDIKRIAEDRGLEIPNPISCAQLMHDKDLVPANKKIIIDDADQVLRILLGRDIETISMVLRDSDGFESVAAKNFPLFGVDRRLNG